MPCQLSNLGYAISSLLHAPTQNPRIWREALIVAIPKLEKPLGNSKNYHPIFLLCVPYKILEKPICAYVEPIVNPLLPKGQVGFQHGKWTVDNVT